MPSQLRVLLIEDSEDDALLLARKLQHGGYEALIERVDTRDDMATALEQHEWDIIISDYVMPHFSAPDAFILLQDKGIDIPFIIISGVVDEETAVAAMKTGAHDFISKGNLARLVPAIERELRDAQNRRDQRQAKKALQESEIRFRELFRNMSSGVAVYEAVDGGNDFIFKDLNWSGELIDKIKRNDVLGKKVTDIFPGIKESGLFDVLQRVCATGEPEYHPAAFYKDRRIERWRNNYVYKLPTGEIVITYDDVTEEKRSEDALRTERKRFFDTLEKIPAFVYLQAPDYSIRFANREFRKVFGDPEGTPCFKIVHGKDEPCEDCPTFSVFESKTQRVWELTRPNGRVYMIYDNYFGDMDGRPLVLKMGIDITEQKLLNDQVQAYSSKITQAYEEERKRIARELHDDTIQLLANLGMEIDALTASSHKLSNDQIYSGLEELRSKTDNLLTGLRHITQALRPPMLDELGLIFALQWLSDETSAQSGITTQFQVKGNERRLSPDRELLLFRVAQEALSNVRKHSEASKANVKLQFYPEKLVLSINDNGKGFKLPDKTEAGAFHTGGLGLIGMRERVKLLNGNLTINSELGKGTTVTVEYAAS
jgi:signal transduction histidine kinase/FixJ family two-component response regulator